MTHKEMRDFLNSGALIRLPSGKVRLWKGPFAPIKFEKNSIFSVACMDFFSAQSEFYKSSESVIETEVSTLRGLLQEQMDDSVFPASSFFLPSFEKFQESFQDILGRIHRGELEKAVPVVFAESPLTPTPGQRARMISHALESHPGLYTFGFWDQTAGVLGATPEVLFQLKDHHLSTMALAGTRSRADELELLKDPKEMKEHMFVVQDLHERLEKFGWVKVGDTHLAEYGILTHLRTMIEVEAADLSVDELMKKLHPTAALGVFPRNYGLQWLKALPYQEQRGIFGAPIVFSLSHNESIALVAIRCLQWGEDKTQIGTGCGLVETSDLQREWKELALKRESVLKILGLSL